MQNRQRQYCQHTGVSTFASHTSQSSNQSLQKSFHLFYPSKLKNKKFPSLLKNKTSQTHSPRLTDKNIHGRHLTAKYLRTLHGDTDDRRAATNSTLAKKPSSWLIEQLCFLKTFVQVDSFVLLNRLLRQAAKRYKPL